MPFAPQLDPYGDLEYAIGTEDDFVCFAFDVDRDAKVVYLASTVNSESAGFIDRFLPTQAVSYADDVLAPYRAAECIACAALDWCSDGALTHDEEGWNQDPSYFARAVHAAITNTGPAIRIAVDMVRRPINTGNYL